MARYSKEQKKEYAIKIQEENEKWLEDFMVNFMKEQHTVPWNSGLLNKLRKHGGGCGITGPYKNGNAWLTYCYLTVFGWDTKQFRTHDQIKKMGGDLKEGVNKDTDYVLIEYPIFKWYDKDGNPAPKKWYKDEEGKRLGYEKKWVGNTLWRVFNLAQTTLEYEPDFVEVEIKKPKGWFSKASKKAQSIINKYFKRKGSPVLEELNYTDTPCYIPLQDKVKIPKKELFKTLAHYFDSLFHEMIHSTGHSMRLNRLTSTSMRTKGYASEELVAEIGASMAMSECGFDTKDYLENDAVYVQHWLQRATETENFEKVIRASFSKANTAFNYIKGEDK